VKHLYVFLGIRGGKMKTQNMSVYASSAKPLYRQNFRPSLIVKSTNDVHSPSISDAQQLYDGPATAFEAPVFCVVRQRMTKEMCGFMCQTVLDYSQLCLSTD
jgi:hypothetical protein